MSNAKIVKKQIGGKTVTGWEGEPTELFLNATVGEYINQGIDLHRIVDKYYYLDRDGELEVIYLVFE